MSRQFYLSALLILACFLISGISHAAFVNLSGTTFDGISDPSTVDGRNIGTLGNVTIADFTDANSGGGTFTNLFGVKESGGGSSTTDPQEGYNNNVANTFDQDSAVSTDDHTVDVVPRTYVPGTTTVAYEFLLDINEPGNNGSFVSLDEFFVVVSEVSNGEINISTGTASDGTVQTNFENAGGEIVVDINSGGTTDDAFLLSGVGSGASNYAIYIPETLFGSTSFGQDVLDNPDDYYFYIFTEFGTTANQTRTSDSQSISFAASSGAESLAYNAGGAATGVNIIPEASGIYALLPLGLLALHYWKRRKSAEQAA